MAALLLVPVSLTFGYVPNAVGNARSAGYTTPAQRCRASNVRAVDGTDEQWIAFGKFNTMVAWTGTATVIDPLTAVPSPSVAYDHFVASVPGAPRSIKTTTTTATGTRSEETVSLSGSGLDVDLDGSYSADHPNGLELAALLGGGTANDGGIVLEHSLACSDRERRRLLLSYDGASGTLLQVLLLVEGRRAEGEAAPPPCSAPPTSLFSLLGVWVGDACMRSVTRAAAGGFGFGGGGFAGGGLGASGRKKSGGKGALAAAVRTAVFKARLSYAWDGGAVVARQMEATSFGEASSASPTATIRAVGELRTTKGEWSDYESVTFAADAARPVLLLLPSSCHILAPTRLPARDKTAPSGKGDAAFAFSTEFGVVLEPGEGFGWRGYQEGDRPPEEDAADDAMRLVRIQRLYDESGSFVSGTTSLCSAWCSRRAAACCWCALLYAALLRIARTRA